MVEIAGTVRTDRRHLDAGARWRSWGRTIARSDSVSSGRCDLPYPTPLQRLYLDYGPVRPDHHVGPARRPYAPSVEPAGELPERGRPQALHVQTAERLPEGGRGIVEPLKSGHQRAPVCLAGNGSDACRRDVSENCAKN